MRESLVFEIILFSTFPPIIRQENAKQNKSEFKILGSFFQN